MAVHWQETFGVLGAQEHLSTLLLLWNALPLLRSPGSQEETWQAFSVHTYTPHAKMLPCFRLESRAHRHWIWPTACNHLQQRGPHKSNLQLWCLIYNLLQSLPRSTPWVPRQPAQSCRRVYIYLFYSNATFEVLIYVKYGNNRVWLWHTPNCPLTKDCPKDWDYSFTCNLFPHHLNPQWPTKPKKST